MTSASDLPVIGDHLAHALDYAGDGLEVFPVDPGSKRPMAAVVPGAPSQYGATTNPDEIEAWWTRWPDALIGHRLDTGHIIIDVDPRHNGKATWDALREEFGFGSPETRIHMSGRNDGGGHLWFRRPEGKLTISRLDDWAEEHGTGHAVVDRDGEPTGHWVCGLDLLHRNHRYTILPPSPHPDTGEPYRWQRWDTVNDAPDALAELLIDRSPPPPPFERKHYDGDSIVEWYSATHGIAEVLDRHGWNLRSSGSGDADGAKWQHPTATGPVSATVRHGCLFVYSPNTPFDVTAPGDPHGYTAFNVFAVLDHDGDKSAAAGAAREMKGGPARARATVDFRPPPANVDAATGEVVDVADPEKWASDDMRLPERFWEARPILGHIRQAAHNRVRSADLVLHGVLARFAAYTPFTFELPALVGSAGSLNFFTIAIGHSGAGKSSGAAIADELLTRPHDIEDRPLGSGEGLAENYMGTVNEEDESGKKRAVRRQVAYNVFVYGDEGAALTEMMERKGATLPEALRRAWTGASLGQSNATAERTRIIKTGMYRLGLLVAFQPEVAAKLMADDIAGTPQRFLFCSATDRSIPERPEDIPEWPGMLDPPLIPMTDVEAHGRVDKGLRRVTLGVDDDIALEIKLDAIKRSRGESTDGAMDSHKPLHLLKLGGLFAMLDGRLDIGQDDWELARIVYDTSCRVRGFVEDAVRRHKAAEQASRLAFHADREYAGELARADARGAVERYAKRIAAWVHDEARDEKAFTKRDLGQRLASKERRMLDECLDLAVDRDWLKVQEDWYVAGDSRPK